MRVHGDWESGAFDLPAVAAGTGPFVRRDLLRAWWRHRGRGTLQFVESDRGLVPLYEDAGTVRFLGEADLTDYHSPLGGGIADLVTEYVSTLDAGVKLHLDSLPAEAAAPLVAGLGRAGVAVTPEQHEIAAVLALPATYRQWLEGLDRKRRHEVRRKERRFEAKAGRVVLERLPGDDGVAVFAALHRLAAGAKGAFMTEDMEAFFAALRRDAGATVDVLRGPADAPVAAAFGFEDDDAYYLYNSAYDPAAADISAGIILLTALVRRAINAGRTTFDFLKGAEAYKSQHGARPRPLFELRVEIGAVR